VKEPSIKGTIFCAVADEIQALRDQGRISEDWLAVALEAADIDLLDKKQALAASWYPIASYARFLDLLCATEGEGSASYYEKRGHMSARRLMDAGLYSQLDLLDSLVDGSRIDDPASREAGMRAYRKRLSVVISLAGSIYNVGQWKVLDDDEHPGRVMIEILDAAAYSDGMVGAIVGFLDECARTVSRNIDRLYRSERPEPDRVLIRMREDLVDVRRAGKR
jgi:hypothetical protein